jgi:hypothetical protein
LVVLLEVSIDPYPLKKWSLWEFRGGSDHFHLRQIECSFAVQFAVTNRLVPRAILLEPVTAGL